MKPNPQLEQFWREYPEYHGLVKEVATFGVSFVPLAIGAKGIRSAFRAPPDADLVLTSSFIELLLPGSLAYSNPRPITLTYVNQANARTVNNIPLDTTCIAGFGNSFGPLPADIWPWPLIVKANTAFTVIASNLDPVTALNVFVTFACVRVMLPAGLVANV